MKNPLLVDMSIHHFDMARFLLDEDAVSVYCESWNPPQSWFDGDASVAAIFRFESGSRLVYSANWTVLGFEESWNGAWRADCFDGSIIWDGDHPPIASPTRPNIQLPHGQREGVEGALDEFALALRTGGQPSGIARANFESLAMVEAAILSSATGSVVDIRDLVRRTLTEPIAA